MVLNLVAGVIVQIAGAQTRFSLVGGVSRSPVQGSDEIYRVNVDVMPFLSPEAEIVSLTGPDGAVAPAVAPEWHRLFVDNLTIEEARTAFSGTWKFTELRDGRELDYYFDLPLITPELFPSAPVIVSPAEGDVVESDLVLDWAYPDGRTDSGFASRSSASNGVRLDFAQRELLDDSSARFPLVFDEGIIEGELSVRVGQSENVPISVVRPTSRSDASFVFQFVSVKAFSLPLTVVGRIPEPNSVALVLAAFAAILPASRSRATR